MLAPRRAVLAAGAALRAAKRQRARTFAQLAGDHSSLPPPPPPSTGRVLVTCQGLAALFASYYAYQWATGGLEEEDDFSTLPDDPTELVLPGSAEKPIRETATTLAPNPAAILQQLREEEAALRKAGGKDAEIRTLVARKAEVKLLMRGV